MKYLRKIPSATKAALYHAYLSRDPIGFVVFSDEAFGPVHAIWQHPEDGPVVVMGERIFEVDPDTDSVFATREEAMDFHYARPKD